MKHILVASNKPEVFDEIGKSLPHEYRVDVAFDKTSCLQMFIKRRYEFTFIDILLLRGSMNENEYIDYKEELQPFRQAFPTAEILIISPLENIKEAVNAVKSGASNYITYPINSEEVRYVCETVYEVARTKSELDYFRDKFWQDDSLELVKTNSPAMKKVFDKIKLVAPTKTSVLLNGETGTGKSVIAKIIHLHSTRRQKQFISLHCGAIPDTLLESELFGHEKGAFTGALRRKLGKFEIASGGTIFLDEVGTISPSAQIKLLEVLQDGTFQRVGGEVVLQSDTRVLAASNVDLKKMCDNGAFRTDLYYRLNAFPIEIPPLRERTEDIPRLVEVFLNKLNKLYSKGICDIHPEVMEAFAMYPWPGNIRELENLIDRAYILESSPILRPESFPGELFTRDTSRAPVSLDTSIPLAELRKKIVKNMEQHYLTKLLALNKGKINRTAKAAGISPRQLHNLLAKCGIRKEDFK